MGAWGYGAFDNDTAGDWVYALEEAEDLDVIEAALDAVVDVGDEYLEAAEAEVALAAAAVVALLQAGEDAPECVNETVNEWVAGHPQDVPWKLAKKTVAALDRILTEPSELLELWSETEDFDAWQTSIVELKTGIVL